MRSAICCALLVWGTLVLHGCGGAGGELAEANEPAIQSTVLAALDLGNGHQVELKQYTSGHVMLIERWQADLSPLDAEVTARFDPNAGSFAQLYEDLRARAIQPPAATPETLASLRAIDQRFAKVRGEPAHSPQDRIGTSSSALRRWGDYNADPGDFNWFSANFCFGFTDYCEVGLGSTNTAIERSRAAIATLFNEHASADDAHMTLSFDPCSNSSPFSFCTKPYQTLDSFSVPHRTVIKSRTWYIQTNEGIVYGAVASGAFYGWGLIFD